MEKTMIAGKAAMAAALSAALSFLGWKGILAICWLTVMALDYVSGTAAAMKDGSWQSCRARTGLWHKCGMIFAVTVAAIADGAMTVVLGNIPVLGIQWPGALLPLVLAWYILTELGSILENAVKLGAAVPRWLTGLLKAGRDAVDKSAGESEREGEDTPDL